MMADPRPAHASVTLHLTRCDDSKLNCAVCLRDNPDWCYTYRRPGTRVTDGMCEECRSALEKTR